MFYFPSFFNVLFKKLLIKLKISLYEEAGSLEKYDFDESLIKIDDYFGKKNSKTMRSKQNILQEVDINFSFSFFLETLF